MKTGKNMRRFGWLTLILLGFVTMPGCKVLDVIKVVTRLGNSGGSGWSSSSGGTTSFDLYDFDLRP